VNRKGQARLIEIVLAVTLLFAFLVVAARTSPMTYTTYSPYYAEEAKLQDLADRIMEELDRNGMLQEAVSKNSVVDIVNYIKSVLPVNIYFNLTVSRYNELLGSFQRLEGLSCTGPSVFGLEYISVKSSKVVTLAPETWSSLGFYLFELTLYEVIST